MIDLCVVSYNTKPKLERLLEVLHSDDDGLSWNLWIFDNNSDDETVEWLLRNCEKYRAELILSDKNCGYAKACNLMASKGTSEFIGLLNADVWLQTNDVRNIIKTFRECTEAAIVGPKQRDEKGIVRHGGIFGVNKRPSFAGRWNVKDPEDKLFREREEALSVSGSAYFVRREVWETLTNDPEYQSIAPGALGAFLPTPFFYEETFLSYFARHRGYKVFYDGTVSIGHSWSASLPNYHPQRVAWMNESRVMFRNACDKLGIERD